MKTSLTKFLTLRTCQSPIINGKIELYNLTRSGKITKSRKGSGVLEEIWLRGMLPPKRKCPQDLQIPRMTKQCRSTARKATFVSIVAKEAIMQKIVKPLKRLEH